MSLYIKIEATEAGHIKRLIAPPFTRQRVFAELLVISGDSKELVVAAPSDGYIASYFVSEGATVQKGQWLAYYEIPD